MTNKIEFTKSAINEIERITAIKGSTNYFRITVKGGGCSGFKYDFSFGKKIEEIDAPLILDLIEGYYLLEKKKITITKLKQKIKTDEMIEICKQEVHDFEKKYIVYKNFRDKGYIINPGIKFGCDFAVYERGPGIDHAPYLVQVYNKADDISSTAVVLAGRLASSVKKQFILAIPSSKNKIDYLSLDWWRAT